MLTVLICVSVFYLLGVCTAIFVIGRINTNEQSDQPYIPLRYCLSSWLFTVLVAITFMEYAAELEAEIEGAILEDEYKEEIDFLTTLN